MQKGRILITGASGGIGKETAKLLSKKNNLVLVARSREALEKTVSELDAGQHIAIECDLTDPEDIQRIFTDAFNFSEQKFDALVHTAGQTKILPLQNIKYEHFEYLMKLNVYSFIELTKYFVKSKYSSGGSIVAVSSVASVKPELCQTLFAASKAALDSAVRSLAPEIAKKGFRINSILPGAIEPGDKSRFSEEHLSAQATKQALGLGKEIEIANLIDFLVSEKASFITGSNIVIDGGRG